MLALSPPLFSTTTYGWPLEDLVITQNHQKSYNYCDDIEANSYDQPILDDDHIATYDQMNKHDHFTPENSISSGVAVNGGTGDDTTVSKKLNHNASERDRRKRVNDLYSFLRSLLPLSSDQKKKVSIPGTVSRALKYIPELQKEVEALSRKKEKLSSYSLTTAIKGGTQEPVGTIKTDSSVVCSVSVLGDKEVVIQLISPADDQCHTIKKNNNDDIIISSLSKVLNYIEEEEDELVLLGATTFKSSGQGRLLINTLHLQVQGDHHRIEAEKLRLKLCSFYQQNK
uniref:transcription factor ORG2-like n=1 Tax=Erigeron canadensis TaxID=72917 RepID=UPI001CB91D37|nr:transcription factor ORG2-like [Erigeron canadensis]